MLDVLAAEGPLHLSDLARRLELAKSSVSDLCTSMVQAGWLRRTHQGFVIGPEMVRYGRAFFGRLDPAREFQRACDETGELAYTAQLAVLGGGLSVVYLARRRGRRGVTVASELGQSLPAHCTGAGKALLAELSPEQLGRRLPVGELLPTLTARSIRDVASLSADLDETRRRGFAIDDGEALEGVFCVARPLPATASSDEQLAVSVTLLKAHLNPEQERVVHDEVDAIHRRLCIRLGR